VSPLRVALAQVDARVGDVRHNTATVLDAWDAAAPPGRTSW